jgi:hypothetical protein
MPTQPRAPAPMANKQWIDLRTMIHHAGDEHVDRDVDDDQSRDL